MQQYPTLDTHMTRLNIRACHQESDVLHLANMSAMKEHVSWQESHKNGLMLCVPSWFCYHPARSTMTCSHVCGIKISTSPHDRPPSHHTNSVWHHSQLCHYCHPMVVHIFNNAGPHHLQRLHHHQELSKRSQVEKGPEPTEKWSRYGLQD